MTYTIVILVNATPVWLTLPQKDKDYFVETELQPVFKKYYDSCSVRMYDSEFTHASISDFLIIETDDLLQYGYLMGYLKQTKTFGAPYFEIKELVMGVESTLKTMAPLVWE